MNLACEITAQVSFIFKFISIKLLSFHQIITPYHCLQSLKLFTQTLDLKPLLDGSKYFSIKRKHTCIRYSKAVMFPHIGDLFRLTHNFSFK